MCSVIKVKNPVFNNFQDDGGMLLNEEKVHFLLSKILISISYKTICSNQLISRSLSGMIFKNYNILSNGNI